MAPWIKEADARLIAAAPDMLEALAEVFADHDKVNSLRWTDNAATAIAKATGKQGQGGVG